MTTLDALLCLRASRRRALQAGLTTAGFPLIAATLAACTRQSEVAIGFIGGLSGRVSDLAIEGRNGVLLALEDANAHQGVKGRPVELHVRDDKQDASEAVKVMKDLADKGVAFVIGPMTSQVAVALAPLADERRMVLISPTATTHELSGRKDHFFRVVPDARIGARQQADDLIARQMRTLITVADATNKAFSNSWANEVAQRFTEKGGRVLAQQVFQPGGNEHLSTLAERITSSGTDAVVIATGAVDAALMAGQLRQLSNKLVIATTPWAGTEQLIALGGKGIDGALVPQYFDRGSSTAHYKRFVSRYNERFGENPGFPATNAYDATSVGLAALADLAEGETLSQSLLRRKSFAGLQKPIQLDEYGDCTGLLHLTQIRAGKFMPVTP